MIAYYVTENVYTRYFILKINDIMLEDKLFNELNENHLYSDTISRSKS